MGYCHFIIFSMYNELELCIVTLLDVPQHGVGNRCRQSQLHYIGGLLGKGNLNNQTDLIHFTSYGDNGAKSVP